MSFEIKREDLGKELLKNTVVDLFELNDLVDERLSNSVDTFLAQYSKDKKMYTHSSIDDDPKISRCFNFSTFNLEGEIVATHVERHQFFRKGFGYLNLTYDLNLVIFTGTDLDRLDKMETELKAYLKTS